MVDKKSYYYELDPNVPIMKSSLAELYEAQAKRNNGKGVRWWRPAYRMTYTEIYHEVRGI